MSSSSTTETLSYRANQAAQRTAAAARSGVSYASTNFMPIVKVGAIIIGAGVAIWAGYKIVNSITGPPGGPCNDPTSPCFAATQPYVQQFNTCLAQYTQNLQQFLSEDSSAGTGLTQAQQDTLTQLRQCMNDAGTNLGKAASMFTTNSIAYVEYVVGTAVAAGIGAYFGAKAVNILRSYKTQPSTGAAAAAQVNNTGIQAAAESGEISTTSASALETNVQDYTSSLSAEDASVLSGYTTVIADFTAEDAAALAAEDATNLTTDAESVLSDLGTLAAGFPGDADLQYYYSDGESVPQMSPIGCGCS